jgi:hypothetical protein
MEQAAGKHPYKRMRLTKLENLQLKENNHVICCTVQPKTIIPASQQGINLSSDPKVKNSQWTRSKMGTP